jgi:hypothetical protein
MDMDIFKKEDKNDEKKIRMRSSCLVFAKPVSKAETFLKGKEGNEIEATVYEIEADTLDELARKAVSNILSVVAAAKSHIDGTDWQEEMGKLFKQYNIG